MSTTTPSSEKAAPVVLPVSLRDYFAACAMPALVSASNHAGDRILLANVLALNAYKIADEMLRARSA